MLYRRSNIILLLLFTIFTGIFCFTQISCERSTKKADNAPKVGEMAEENVTIPCIIDNMDNKVNLAYNAHPDRLFLIRKDGTLAVAAGRGPKGFKPALEKANEWLEQYKKTGAEPESSSN